MLFARLKSQAYSLFVVTFFTLIMGGVGYVTYQLYVNYFPAGETLPLPFVSVQAGESEFNANHLFLLRSQDTVNTMREMGFAAYNYDDRLNRMSEVFTQQGFTVEIITEKDITRLPRRAALFAIDTIALSKLSAQQIKSFVAEGGTLFANYHFGFHSEADYRGLQLINELTALEYVDNVPYFTTSELLYFTPRVLSPLTQHVKPEASKIGVETYDPIPVLRHPSLRADLISSNWLARAPIVATTQDGSEYTLKADESGLMWHGRYGKGKWVYTSLPSYSLYASPDAYAHLMQLMKGVAEHSLTQSVTASVFPYLDAQTAIYVSEDTEYRFESFDGFIKAANKYKIPVTAFIVAELADKNQDLMDFASQSPFIEIASHSYTHTKIMGERPDKIAREITGSKKLIDQLAQSNLTGFRPPREEIDDEMYEELMDAGYRYVLGPTTRSLYPQIERERNNLVFIPRTGTDDYQYLVNLDWNPEQILARMMLETEHLSASDGLFSLSIHTHLMAYKSNIEVVERYFDYLSAHPEFKTFSGQQLVDRVLARDAINFKVDKTRRNFIVQLTYAGHNPLNTISYRLFWPAGVTLGEVKSELVGTNVSFEHYPEQGYTDISLDNVSPRSSLSLIIPFDTL
ncbi:MAG: polysaccharide deacetylase family protein [Pontibacterium sp.]